MQAKKKYKVCRRLGPGIYEKCQTDKYALREARRRPQRRGRRRRSSTNYNMQLMEKQRVRFSYGLSERQFSRYVRESTDSTDVHPTENLYARLESRLDNVVYRLGLAPTRAAARQMVAHGHILVNGRKIRVPSHNLKKKDTLSIREGSREKVLFHALADRLKEHTLPSWLAFDVGTGEAVIQGLPLVETSSSPFDLTSVIEFYSR